MVEPWTGNESETNSELVGNGGEDSSVAGAMTTSSFEPEGKVTTDHRPIDETIGNGKTDAGIGQEGPTDKSPPQPNHARPQSGIGLDTIDYSTVGTGPSTSSFAQLAFRTFESYINEARVSDQFPPLQMLQHMNLCGGYGSDGLARLTGPSPVNYHLQGRPLEPIAIRHIHSTPLQHTSSIMDDEDEYEPPPLGLEILNRSRSTPLSTSKNSAFGTILRTNSHTVYDGRHIINSNSAFTLMPGPYPMLKSSSRSAERGTKPAIFNPIKHDVEMEGEGELTSIEIVDLPLQPKEESIWLAPKSPSHGPKMNPASRAAKFLTDIRNLGLRHKPKRGGRENPAMPPSESDESSSRKKAPACTDEETISSKSSGNSSEKDPMSATSLKNDSSLVGKSDAKLSCSSADESVNDRQSNRRHKTDSQKSDTRYTMESPSNVPSPVYHRLVDSPMSSCSNTNHTGGRNRVSIHVNHVTNVVGVDSDRSAYIGSSQDLGRAAAPTPQGQDSPQASESLSTTSSSGHSTHVASTSHSSGHATNLSSVSETDREVMEVNNRNNDDGNVDLADREEDITASDKTDRIELSLSGRNVRFGDYVELVDTPSPVNGRDGASVKADRFFTKFSDSSEKRGTLHRLRGLGSKSKAGSSHSPNTVSSASANTSSSGSSIGDEPPKIVSYLDRKQVSDLSSALQRGETSEASSPRAGLEDREVRDSSPSDQVLAEDSEIVFEGAQAPKAGASNNPRPLWPGKGLQLGRKIRSLPPRSPHKGLRSTTTTPPPCASPSYGISPPRPIVDHKGGVDPNLLYKSYVVAPITSRPVTTLGTQEMLSSSGNVRYTHVPGAGPDQGSHEVVRLSPIIHEIPSAARLQRGTSPTSGIRTHSISPVGGRRPRTYEESSIEILKADSKEDSNSPSSPIPLVTPEKGPSS